MISSSAGSPRRAPSMAASMASRMAMGSWPHTLTPLTLKPAARPEISEHLHSFSVGVVMATPLLTMTYTMDRSNREAKFMDSYRPPIWAPPSPLMVVV